MLADRYMLVHQRLRYVYSAAGYSHYSLDSPNLPAGSTQIIFRFSNTNTDDSRYRNKEYGFKSQKKIYSKISTRCRNAFQEPEGILITGVICIHVFS